MCLLASSDQTAVSREHDRIFTGWSNLKRHGHEDGLGLVVDVGNDALGILQSRQQILEEERIDKE
jgi:hypothetical protein